MYGKLRLDKATQVMSMYGKLRLDKAIQFFVQLTLILDLWCEAVN